MLFPNIEDFATTDIVTVGEAASVREAVQRMVGHNIRDVVIVGDAPGSFGIFTAADLIRMRCDNVDLDQALCAAGYRPLPVIAGGTNVLEALAHFSAEDEYICVTHEDGRLGGVISYTDLVTGIDPQMMIERQRVRDLLMKNRIKTVTGEAPLAEVLPLLSAPSDAVVVTVAGRPAGIITTKDALHLVDADVPLHSPVASHMSTPLQIVPPDLTIRQAVDYLREKHFKRLVVGSEEEGVIGVVTQRELVAIAFSRWADLMRNHALELRELVDLLEQKTARLEQLAATDRLTGVANRARFEEQLIQEMERVERYRDEGFALLLLDIDNFKFINDTWGHLRGDSVLKTIARTAARQLRGVDTFARWGGEEFIALLPHTDLDGARNSAERVRAAVAQEAIDGIGQVTVSVGVTVYHPGETPRAIIDRGDTALYSAKGNGRNRVEVA